MTSFQCMGMLSIALALSCSSGPSAPPQTAANPAGQPGHNSDGDQCEVLFSRVDANSDAKLSEAEFSTIPHPQEQNSHTTFVLRDQNQDGALSKEEFCAPERVALR
jgi:hypothetical protein